MKKITLFQILEKPAKSRPPNFFQLSIIYNFNIKTEFCFKHLNGFSWKDSSSTCLLLTYLDLKQQ